MVDQWKAPAEGEPTVGDDKSWKLLEKTLLAGVQEQRRARRWGIFFKSLTFLYLIAILFLFTPLMDMERSATKGAGYTALIDVQGVIADKEAASADNLITSLRAAFDDPKVKGVVLRINSPGGSPVQSGYVYDEIRRLRGLHPDTKVYAVISDLGASGLVHTGAGRELETNRRRSKCIIKPQTPNLTPKIGYVDCVCNKIRRIVCGISTRPRSVTAGAIDLLTQDKTQLISLQA